MQNISKIVNSLDHCLLVVRHGQTQWNVEDRLTTSTDLPLNEKGLSQAKRLENGLAGSKFLTASASPLQRAYETGRIATGKAFYQGTLKKDPRLVEPSAGPSFEGKSFKDMYDQSTDLGKLFAAYSSETNPVFPDECETLDESSAKAASFYQDIVDNPGRHFAATHGAFARIMACVILGQDPAYYRRYKLDNCAAALFKIYPSGPPQMIFWNVQAGMIG